MLALGLLLTHHSPDLLLPSFFRTLSHLHGFVAYCPFLPICRFVSLEERKYQFQESQVIMLRNTSLSSAAQAALSIYRAEREVLLARIVSLLEVDPRVLAAFAFGSVGRKESDDLSDLDLFVVLDDISINAIRESGIGQVAYLAQMGPLLADLSAPQNAPRGGAYRMALYEGVHGPHQVDWYSMGETQLGTEETLASDTLILLDRIDLAEKPRRAERLLFPSPLPNVPDPEEAHLSPLGKMVEDGRSRASAFWAMLGISAKYVARQRDDEELFLGEIVRNRLRDLAEFSRVGNFVLETGAFPQTAVDKIAYLRQRSTLAEEMLPAIAAQGAIGIPFALAASSRRYLDLIASLIDG